MYSATYRDCVKSAAFVLKLEDAYESLVNGTETDAPEAVKKEIGELTECVGLVLDEIACDYVPLKKIEKLKTDDRKIYYRDFEINPIDIFAVKNGGLKVAFKVFFDSVLLPYDGRFDVEYSYAPAKGGLGTELDWDTQRVSERIVGYGAACEYCLINGMADEAAMWDKRFKDALFKGAGLKHELKIKKRAWY